MNGVAACNVGRKVGIPVVYEMRALWEDAAVDHGTSREGGPRYRLSRALESRLLRRADAITTICDGLRQDILSRGIPGEKVTVVPNAVDVEKFTLQERDGDEVMAPSGFFVRTGVTNGSSCAALSRRRHGFESRWGRPFMWNDAGQ